MDLQIEKGSGAKPRATFYSDGTPTDLDGACTVTLLKPDGTAGPASGTVTHIGTNSGLYEFTLGQQTECIYYDVTWAGTIGAVATSIQTRVEVVGAFLYPLAALRAVKVAGGTPFNATDYPNDVVLARRVQVTDDFQRKAGWSFIPRFAREIHDGDGTDTLILDQLKVQRVITLTIGGTSISTATANLDVDGSVLTRLDGGTFTAGRRNVVVEYVHGWNPPPPEATDKALARTAMLLLPSQAGSTVSSWTTPDGTTYSYDQAGQAISGGGRRHYGVPAIDSFLNDPAYSARGAVFS